MKTILSAGIVGFIFSLGLGLAGMTQPQKVIGFLDFFGDWDPSLAFVMIGAITVHFIFYKIIRKRNSPLFSTKWDVPEKSDVTPSLVVGSLIFGIGWGLGGYCPGPAITALGSLDSRPFVFVISMLTGMFIFKLADKKINFNR